MENEVQSSTGSIITLVVGVGVAIMVLIFVSVLGGNTYNVSQSTIDDIGVSDESENSTLAPLYGVRGHTMSCLPVVSASTFVVTNGSGGAVIPTTNYTLTLSTGVFNLSDATFNNSNTVFSYECGDATIRTSVEDSVTSGFTALEQTGNYLPLIVLAVVIFLVLSLVLGFTSFAGKSSGRGIAL